MLTQAYTRANKNHQPSLPTIPTLMAHYMPKLSIFIFCSHRVQLQALQTQGTGKRQPAGNTHSSPLELRSPRAHTSATRAALHRTVFPKKTIRKQAEALYRIDTRFLLSHSCRKVSVKTVRSLQPAESKSSWNIERCWFPCSEEPAETCGCGGPGRVPWAWRESTATAGPCKPSSLQRPSAPAQQSRAQRYSSRCLGRQGAPPTTRGAFTAASARAPLLVQNSPERRDGACLCYKR